MLQTSPWDADAPTLANYQAYLMELAALPEDQLVAEGSHLTAGHMLRLALPGTSFTVRNRGWLNDELMNCIMAQLQTQKNAQSVHFFSSFFLAKLFFDNQCKVVYDSVRRWTMPNKLKKAGHGKANILQCALLVAPCNLHNQHWCMVVVDIQRKQLLYLDPKHVRESVDHYSVAEIMLSSQTC